MPDPADAPPADTIATERIRPDTKPDTSKKPAKLSYDDMVGKWTARGYPKAVAQGIADNMMRESKGDPTAVGDGGTSRGLFQHHDTRKTGLEAYAKKLGKSPDDPDVQIDFADQELKNDYPTLRKFLMAGTDRADAEDSFKRVFERPASVMWQNKPGADQPNLASDRFRFSDYALNEHNDRPNTDVRMMTPQDYLDLTPDLEGSPFRSPSGRSLVKSVNNGDEVQSIPSLDMRVSGKTGTVTDQDGRHRALLAQQEGLDAIPVAVHKTGQGEPTEIQGMTGNILPHDFPKAADVPKSLWRRAADAVMPSAEAAEPGVPAGLVPVEGNPFDEPKQNTAQAAQAAPAPGLVPVEGNPFADEDKPGILKRIGTGLTDAAVGLNQAVAHIPDPMGFIPGPQNRLHQQGVKAYDQYVKDREAKIKAERGGDDSTDWYRTGGNALAATGIGLLFPELGPATSGALSTLLTPSTSDNYAQDKAKEAVEGAVGGKVAGTIGNALSKVVAPRLEPFVKKLMGEGVELTPGQMAGGRAKAYEDKMMSVPITGDAITKARQRSFEDFNRAAWNRVLEPLGERLPDTVEMGRPAAKYVSDRLRAEYGRILPSLSLHGVQNDPQFVQDLATAVSNADGNLPDAHFNTFRKILRAQLLEKLGPAGTSVNGDLINGIDSELGRKVRGYKGDQGHDNQELGHHLEEVQAAFRRLLERQNPHYAPDLKRLREAYATHVRVARAEAAAGTARNAGIFSPAQLDAAVRAEDHAVRKLGYARGDALLQDLSDAGAAVLPSQYPDSGTAGRKMMAAMLGLPGAGYSLWSHDPAPFLATLGAGLAGAAPYTARVNNLTNHIMNRLTQPPGPTRNALSAFANRAGQAAAPAFGVAAPQMLPNNRP